MTAINRETGEEERFRVAGPDSCSAHDVKAALAEAHPEWKRMRATRVRKPSWWTWERHGNQVKKTRAAV